MARIRFANAEGRRIELTNEQAKRIRQLYVDASKEIADRAKFFQNRTNISSVLRTQYLKEMQDQLNQRITDIDNQTTSIIESGIHSIAKAVVEDNAKMMEKMGFTNFTSSTAFFYVPDIVVKEVASGKLYEGRWDFSKAIWGDNKQKLDEINYIVAKGIAENKSAYDLAKDLEKYVNPNAKKDWEWSKVYPGTRKVVDYCAQRLSRTMISHAYADSFVRTTKDNPFIEAYKWLTSNSDRVCPICIEREQNDSYGLGAGVFPKDQLPLDHPNGMCTFEIVTTGSLEQIGSKIHDWMYGEGDEQLNSKIDKYVESLTNEKKNSGIQKQTKEQESKQEATTVVQGSDISNTWERRPDQFDFEIEDVINAQGFDGLPRVVSADEFEKYVKESNFVAQRAYSAPDQETLEAYRNELYNGKWYVDCSTGGARHGQGMYCIANYDGKITDGMVAEANSYATMYGSRPSYTETFTMDKTAKFIDENNARLLMAEANKSIMRESYEKALRETTTTESVEAMIEKYEKYFGVRMSADEMKTYMTGLQLKNMGSEAFTGSLKKETQDIIKQYKLKDHSLVQSKYMTTDAYNETAKKTFKDLGSYCSAKGYDGIKVSGREDEEPYLVVLNRTKCIFKEE